MADSDGNVIGDAPFDGIQAQIALAGGEWQEPAAFRGSVGRTTFDNPASEDNSITVLLPHGSLQSLPSQTLVRIVSQPDKREYLGVVVKGPFAEPDGLRPDSHLVIMTTIHGGMFMPTHHGRVHVELLGQQID